jgi:hypothetical protein
MNEVEICVEDTQGVRQTMSVPTDMNLNLMEVLKASEYPIQGYLRWNGTLCYLSY